MSLKTQIAADVTAVFFNTDEFAEPARIWDGSASISTSVIPGIDETLNGPSAWPLGESQQQTFQIMRSAVAAPRKGMEVEIISSGEFWTIQEHRPSGPNVWIVVCVRSLRGRA